MYEITRRDGEIDEQLNRAGEWEERGGSAVRGMSYEQGVLAGIRWVTGETNDLPIEKGPDD